MALDFAGTTTVVLASASPRRARLLRALLAGSAVPLDIRIPPVDDGMLHLPLGGASLTAALACIKALQVECSAGEVVVAADTLALCDGDPLGKPRDAEEARDMLERLAGRWHEVVTGVALRRGTQAEVWVESARVELGWLRPGELDAYLASGAWRGKAAAYDYPEVAAAGWPLRCEGDITTVSGLPIESLRRRLGSVLALHGADR